LLLCVVACSLLYSNQLRGCLKQSCSNFFYMYSDLAALEEQATCFLIDLMQQLFASPVERQIGSCHSLSGSPLIVSSVCSNLAALAFSMTACTSEVGILYLISQASLKPSITSLLSALVDSSCTLALADGRMNGRFDLI